MVMVMTGLCNLPRRGENVEVLCCMCLVGERQASHLIVKDTLHECHTQAGEVLEDQHLATEGFFDVFGT